MIKIQDIKHPPKEAALLMVLSALENFGWERSQEDILEAMSDKELVKFMQHYANVYNKLADKVGADPLLPEQLLHAQYAYRYKDVA